MKWTVEQQEAISLRGKNILVSAAAGSGKTAVLVERIKGLILEDHIDLSEMLIVTFSNAAAAEMKEKIVRAISKEMDGVGGNLDKEIFLRRQLSLIHKANISTFHAFAMEVIRRYFHFISIEPDFKICDEGQKTILQAEAMEQLFSSRFQSKDQEFLSFLHAYAGSKNEKSAKEMIVTTYEFIQSIPNSFEWLFEKVEKLKEDVQTFQIGVSYNELKNNFKDKLFLTLAYFKQAETLLLENGLEKLSKKCSLDISAVEQIQMSLERESYQEAIREMNLLHGKFQRLVAGKAEKEEYQQIKEQVSAFRDKGKERFNSLYEQYGCRSLEDAVKEIQDTYPMANILSCLVKEFDQYYSEKKRKKGVIDFNDIEHYALDILEHEEASMEYRNKFRYIFIDEYQDSNIVQETLIDRIKRDNNVFMVGDVKQSIYKFRLAEPELFIQKYESYQKGTCPENQKLDLNRNFRSKGTVINGINHIFSQIMHKHTTGLAYDSAAALYKGVDYEGDLEYSLSLHVVDDAKLCEEEIDDAIKEMKRAEVEAYAAVQIIKEAKGKQIYDWKNQCVRSLESRDIVILLRGAKTDGPIYFQALTDAGIPAFVDNSDGYFDTIEIQIFLNLLRLIDNKKQDLPLLSVLRSPIFDFTIDEMAEIRIAKKLGTYYEAFVHYSLEGEAGGLRNKCNMALKALQDWGRNATYMPLEELLWKLIEETGYYQYIGGIPGGLQRQANLRSLVDKAVQYQTTQKKGLFAFIHYIEALQNKKISTGQVKLIGETDDVVRIMTIHKSKGLEFPFVLVGGMAKRFQVGQKSSVVSLHKDLGLGLRLVDVNNHCYTKTLLQRLIEEKKKKEDMAEEIRILYVAFTRAMDQLVLLGTVTDLDRTLEKYQSRQAEDASSAKSYLDLLLPAITDSDIQIYYHDRSAMSAVKQQEDEEKEGVSSALARGFLLNPEVKEEERICSRLEYHYPYLAANNMKSKYSVSELAKEAAELKMEKGISLSKISPKFLQTKKIFSGAERGTILHRIMEHLCFEEMPSLQKKGDFTSIRDKILQSIAMMVRKEMLSAEEAEVADLTKLTAFFCSDIGKRVCHADEIYKETSFNLRKKRDGEEIMIQGTIDCYFLEGNNCILLDYKSNSVKETESSIEEIKERYASQLMLYQEALEKIKGITVKEKYLYLFSIDQSVRI